MRHWATFGVLAVFAACADGEPDESGADADTDADTDTDTDSDTDSDADGDPELGFARIIFLVADVAAVDLAVNDTQIPLAEDFPFPGSTPFLPLPPFNYSVQFHEPIAESTGPTGEVFLRADDVEVDSNTYQTVAAIGIDQISVTTTVVYPDDLTPASSGNVKVRFINACLGLTGVDVLDAYTGGEILAEDVAFGTPEAYVELPAGEDVVLWVDYTGDGNGEVPYLPLNLPATDSLGFPQVVNIWLLPTGAYLYEGGPPVPFFLTQPIDSPDGMAAITPNTG